MTYQLPQPDTLHWNSPEERARAARLSKMVVLYLKQASNAIPMLGPLVSGGFEVLQGIADDADQRRLEVRLEELIVTGGSTTRNLEQLRKDIQVLTALSAISFTRQQELLDWLQTNQEPVKKEELPGLASTMALAAYRAHVALTYSYVDHRGIQGAGRMAHIATLPLDDVYVQPLLLPERSQLEMDERERVLLKQLEDHDLDPDQHVRLVEEYASLSGERWGLANLGRKDAVAVSQALASIRHAVVLGTPGVGKSTLIRYLARTCALDEQHRRLSWDESLTPIVIPLADYAVARVDRPDLSIRDFINERAYEHGGLALQAATARELDAGRLLVLLDGVDEIPEHLDRLHVVQAVDQFLVALRDVSEGPRCLVTSRPNGYIRLAGPIPHFQLPNFTAQQVQEFVHNWQRALEYYRRPDAPDEQFARQEAESLLDELQRHPKVAELARNPLMLVIVLLIRYEQARLPEERVHLYHRAVLTLLDSWNYSRSLTSREVGGVGLPVAALLRVLGRVAEWSRREKPTGIIHRAELKRELVRILKEEELDDEDPDPTAESYLRAAAERAGLLEERGPQVFAFWHATFEEFLAAVELATPVDSAIQRLLPLRANPRWREVILLAVGYVGVVHHDSNSATRIVTAIAEEHPSPTEPVFHSNLLLAAACVADDAGVKRSLAERIAVRLARAAAESPYQYREREVALSRLVRGLPRLRPRPDTVAMLCQLWPELPVQARSALVYWLANVAATNSDAKRVCERQVDRERSIVERFHAALALSWNGGADPKIWEAIATFLEIEGGAKQWTTVQRFLNAAPTALIASLVSLLEGEDTNLQLAAATLLAERDDLRRRALQTLRRTFNSSHSASRIRAASILVDLGETDEDIRQEVYQLHAAEDPKLARTCIKILIKMGRVDDSVRRRAYELIATKSRLVGAYRGQNSLMSCLEHEQVKMLLSNSDPHVRYAAASYLSDEFGMVDDAVLEGFRSVLSDDYAYVVWAAETLQALSDADFELVHQTARRIFMGDHGYPAVTAAAGRLLVDLGQLESALETAVRAVSTTPWRHLAVCEKVINGEPLTIADGGNLAYLLRVAREDSREEQGYRQFLFDWFHSVLLVEGQRQSYASVSL
jgi:hypothetical protein